MTSIAKIDPPAVHPSVRLWIQPQDGLLARIQAEMQARQAHPARTLVLLPYAQLRPLAARLWAQCYPDGFAPQFETTQNWSSAMGRHNPGGTDVTFDMALDTLTAGALLRGAGLGAQQEALAGLLVQAAHQLAPLAAACAPSERQGWLQSARLAAVVGMDGPALALEAAVARIAVEWVAQSAYASDVLFDADVQSGLDCLVLVQGFSAEPLVASLQAVWGPRLATLALPAAGGEGDAAGTESIGWHACGDAEDEAERSAACAIAHIAAGRIPVALVCTDRALTRRIRSMLESAGVQIRDENGWKLSTSHAAGQVMGLLTAAAWNASSDAVLAWLKVVPAVAAQLTGLERAIRKDQAHAWRSVSHGAAFKKVPDGATTLATVDALRDGLQGTRTLTGWLVALRQALQDGGQWDALQADGVGAEVLQALRLPATATAQWEHFLEQTLWSSRRMDLAEFTNWANQALEGASFSPPYPTHEQLVILPMSQMLARPFAAVVLAGCDDVRLNPSPEPPGGWTAVQRAALGLPARETLQASLLAAWQHALHTPYCDVLWRCSDEAGEVLSPSPLVLQVQLAKDHAAQAADPRLARPVAAAPTLAPMPTGNLLPLTQLSASAYEDLRNCPYRFFALRQLGLQSLDELEGGVDKRDFGLWLHEVLKRFHQTLAQAGDRGPEERLDCLQAASVATTQAMGLSDGEFLPFAASWPRVRDGYLRWLAQHEATGAQFFSAETSHAQPLGSVKLVGRIDRIDRQSDGTQLVLDYKTENAAKTAARVKQALEDTQIAFYAALLPDDHLQGAYVNIGEREGTKAYAQPDIERARDVLLEGITSDLARIAQGAPLPALGAGATCDFCQARGLCRKDFWAAV